MSAPSTGSLTETLSKLGRPIVIVSHRRSGTHLTLDTLRLNFPETRGWKWPTRPQRDLYTVVEHLTQGNEPIDRLLRRAGRAQRPLFKAHSDPGLPALQQSHPELHAWLYQHADWVYVYRDVRRVMCSLHLYMRRFSPDALKPLAEFIRQEDHGRNRITAWRQHVEGWLDAPDARVIPIAFESLINDRVHTIRRLGNHLRLQPMPDEPRLPAKLRSRFHSRVQRVLTVRPQATTTVGRSDGLQPVDWRQELTPDDLAWIDQQIGPLPQRLEQLQSPSVNV
ncbi:MAG: sulfotransferase domain-containing protein [Planctomycetota bacterium]